MRAHPPRWLLVAALVAGFVAGVPLGAEAAVAVPDRPMRAAFGALLGARVAGRVDGRRLGPIFAVVVLGAAAAPALDAARAP